MKLTKIIISCCCYLAITLSSMTYADVYYLGYGRPEVTKTIKDQAGLEFNLKNEAEYLRAGWELQNKTFIFGLGAAGTRYTGVEATTGATIEADTYNGYVETGYSHKMTQAMHFDILTGYEYQFSGKSEWQDCSTCEQSAPELEMTTGVYFLPRLRLQAGRGWMLTFAYHYYSTGDIKDMYTLNFGISY